MTDLPQLEALLVDAARRRRRTRRVRRGAVRVLVPIAIVALAFVIIPWVGREAPDREIPAKTPTPAPSIESKPTTTDAAYRVFRRPARAADKLPNAKPGDVARRIAATQRTNAYLLQRGRELCLVTTDTRGRTSSISCGPVKTYLDGRRPIGTFSDERGPSLIAYAFPDGVRSVRLTLENGTVGTYRVTTNGFARDLPARPVKLEWTAPDGTAQSSEFDVPTPRAADFYSVLKRPVRQGDQVDGLPGGRLVVTLEHATAYLVPRQGAVCLVLQNQTKSVSGCRHNVADVRYPLVVALAPATDRGEIERVVAAVYPDAAKNISVIPPVRSARSANALIIAQGETAKQLRSQISSDAPPRTETLPAGNSGFVLHAREEHPTSIPPETG